MGFWSSVWGLWGLHRGEYRDNGKQKGSYNLGFMGVLEFRDLGFKVWRLRFGFNVFGILLRFGTL